MAKTNKIGFPELIVLVVGSILILWLLLNAFGVIDNFMGWDAKQAGIGGKIGLISGLLITAYQIYLICSGKVELKGGSVAIAALFFCLSVMAGTGFNSTAGDIGQRVSSFNYAGKIVDKNILFEYYNDFYHLDTDTALVNYINKYDELPGRNNHNAYIILWLRGDTVNGIPPSTAPRANEQFEWHSHNDNSIYKKGNK